MIKTVIFDLDDTLYDFAGRHTCALQAVCAEAEKRLGVAPEKFMGAYSASMDLLLKHMRSENWIGPAHSRVLRFQNTLEQLQLPIFPYVMDFYHLYWDTILTDMAEEPGIREVLELLSEKKIPVGIGTNMTGLMQYKKLMKLNMTQYIRYMVSSDETNADKPSPFFFRVCVEKSGFRPEECLFIGDNFSFDYEGAKNAGLNALWYNPHYKTGHEDVTEVIHSHRELLEIIRSW